MPTTTVYTSRITVPVYACWRCEKCAEVNFSTGRIVCERQESTMLHSRREATRAAAANRVMEEWSGEAYRILSDPRNHAKDMRKDLRLSARCSKCGKKPRWEKDMRYRTWGGACILVAVFFGYLLATGITSVATWVLFGIFSVLGVAVCCIGFHHDDMMRKLPDAYMPVLGSLNPEWIEYARARGTIIPAPDACLAAVGEAGQIPAEQQQIPEEFR